MSADGLEEAAGSPAGAPARPRAAAAPAARRRVHLAVAAAVLAVLYAAGIFWASHQPSPFPFVPGRLLAQDKVLHAVVYAGLAFLVRIALAGTRLSPRAAFLGAVLAASAYGVTDEIHQSFVPNRQAEVRDWLADTGGAVAGAALAAAFLRGRRVRASIRG